MNWLAHLKCFSLLSRCCLRLNFPLIFFLGLFLATLPIHDGQALPLTFIDFDYEPIYRGPVAQSVPAPVSNREGIAPELQGRYPIHIPTYDGVEQLLVLSNQWVIVAIANLAEVSQNIQNLLNKGGTNFLQAQKEILQSIKEQRLNYSLLRAVIEPAVDQYQVAARREAGELLDADGKAEPGGLDDANTYRVISDDDPAYQSAQNAKRVTRFLTIRGGTQYVGFDRDYAHYAYLELPTPLVNGKTYTITVSSPVLKMTRSVTFLYDELRTVSRAIKVNQIGYLPDVERKYAYLGCYLQEFGPMDFSAAKTFSVVDVQSGNRILEGQVKLRVANPVYTDTKTPILMCGEDVYELDLTDLRQPGTYFLSIPGVGRSWPFKVDANVYGEAFYTAMRGMFAQRCGIALTSDYSAWTRIQCHPDDQGNPSPTCECQYVEIGPFMDRPKDYEIFDVIGATLDCTKNPVTGHIGGYHDASDWDKSSYHYGNVLAMLTLFEMFPNKFTDGQLHLPSVPEFNIGGSGDGIPDILDEAEFGLMVWKKSLTPEGAASATWETSTHPSINNPEYRYAYGLRTRWTTLLYATAAAQLAYLIRPFNAEKAALWEADAKKAYAYGLDPNNALNIRLRDVPGMVDEQGNIIIHARRDRGKGEPFTYTWKEKEEYHEPYLASAKIRLYLLSITDQNPNGDPSYLDGLPELMQKNPVLMTPPPYAAFSHYTSFLYHGLFSPVMESAITRMDETRKQAIKSVQFKCKQVFTNVARELVVMSATDPYRRSRQPWARGGSWGWGMMNNQGRWLLLGHYITGDPTTKAVAAGNADYQLGVNPNGMAWTTGMGFVYPIHIQHAISEDDDILDPFPGIAIYGPTDISWWRLAEVWLPTNAQKQKVRFLSSWYWLENGDFKEPPDMRRYATHPWLVPEHNEFTVHETMASNLFVYGYLMNDNWMPSERLKNRKPREDSLLFGYWYLP